jgi:uncharacterized membrane protein HdeD (DUF308 family)
MGNVMGILAIICGICVIYFMPMPVLNWIIGGLMIAGGTFKLYTGMKSSNQRDDL